MDSQQLQCSSSVFIPSTELQPSDYPSREVAAGVAANDMLLCGERITPTNTASTSCDTSSTARSTTAYLILRTATTELKMASKANPKQQRAFAACPQTRRLGKPGDVAGQSLR